MSFRLTDKQYQQVREYCDRTDTSMSQYIKGLIEDDFNRHTHRESPTTPTIPSPSNPQKKVRTFKETKPDPRILNNPFNNVLRTSERHVPETEAQ